MARTESFTVPSVTEQDLYAFHASHFAQAPLPSRFFVSPEGPEDFYEEDDGLGYYPDGAKRTLTDEQIAMFRHSETQTLLRERRQRRERAESGEHEAFEGTDPTDGRSPSDGKRKWEQFIEISDSNPDMLTHRRLARELDEQQTEAVDLAYGDEDDDSARKARDAALPSTIQSHGRKKPVVYEEADEPRAGDEPATQPEPVKKTFQWPVLGQSVQ
ncbi:hypothetical protein H2203_005042 [Taxawa tesnikishii (nom. ined.)]|nr:hypothetical protein H2203_005042 [Dothideales sp. JES 119]